MNCLDLERALDAAALSPEVLAHASTCERCARALSAARELDSELLRHFAMPGTPEALKAPKAPLPPEGMTDRIIEDYWMTIGTNNKEFDVFTNLFPKN